MTTRALPRAPEKTGAAPHVGLSPVKVSFVLSVLGALFAGRVAAQLGQWVSPREALPGFEAWQSGLIPYGLLLSAQLLILAGFTIVIWRLARGKTRARPALGRVLLSLGAIYFSIMAFRFGGALVLGSAEGSFFARPLPAFFHLVLSAWLIVLGLYHERGDAGDAPPRADISTTAARWLAYPVLIASCLLLHLILLRLGLKLQFSSYLPVAFGALVITLLERRLPHREEWQPNHEDVGNDLTFMVFVQILLPKVLAFLVAVTVLRFLHQHGVGLTGWWPHGWPPVVQAALMLLAADFLRYWLHRGSHEWSPWLWRFHAVHHSPPKLYWVNVGRFHPVEKSLQFLCDAAPFILVGVSEQVLALYFVFYAVNGFFQHCNADVRLGLLNVIISGPELHRWHHSREVRESNKNYGNNVIIWDLFFGSYFLPKNQTVQSLGLPNRSYPLGFLRQLRTPFIKGLDQAQE